ITANEASAVGSMRTLSNAVMQYASMQRKLPQNILELGPQGAGLIDPVLASGQKSGYRFTYELTDRDNDGSADGYQVRGEPITPGTTGVRHFYSDESGVIRMSSEGSADANSPPVGSA
ncbi:MAG: pili assembly chaperone, partial [Candidatus Acidiferrales bacterium]